MCVFRGNLAIDSGGKLATLSGVGLVTIGIFPEQAASIPGISTLTFLRAMPGRLCSLADECGLQDAFRDSGIKDELAEAIKGEWSLVVAIGNCREAQATQSQW
jgi:hypothetical protein